MNEFIKAISKSEIADGEKKLIELDDALVLLFRVGDDFYCIDDICTHDGGPLSDGEHFDCQVVCPRHGATFDIRTGEPLCMPATEATRTHETRVDGDDVLIKLAED